MPTWTSFGADYDKSGKGGLLVKRGRSGFGAVLIPMPMMRVAMIANEYHVPFAVALKRIRDVRPELLSAEATDPQTNKD